MTADEVVEFIGLIADAFPERVKVSAGTVAIWGRMLMDITPSEAGAALVSYLSDGPPHPPSISDIRTRVANESVAGLDVAAAWEEVRRGISTHGSYKEPSWSNPLLAATVDTLGWRDICMTLESDLPTLRAQFERYLKARAMTAQKSANLGRLDAHVKRIGAASAGDFLRLRGRS